MAACPHCGRMLRDPSLPTPLEMKTFLAYLSAGTAKQAAADLGVSTQTVKNRLSRLYHRVGCDNAAQVAYRVGRGEWDQKDGES